MRAADPQRPIVTLTTDFGLTDPYVAAMKGGLLSINPWLTIVDVTHDVLQGRVLQAVFLTQCAWPFFPADAIHVAVVDPGVGTERRAIALETPRGRYVGPDNGVLSSALPDAARPGASEAPGLMQLPAGYRGVSITNRRYMLEPVSATFHGRDIFAPAAAHLAVGVPIDDLGEQIDSIIALPPLRATRDADGSLRARVLHIDRFGNVITDVRAVDLPEAPFVVDIAGRAVPGPVRTYAVATGLAAIVGSSGYLEIALPNGSAADELGVDIGAAAVLRPAG
jgi:hypothetical protein